ncbi:adenine-specific DNA-methyltransferase [Fodinibius roseus]|uniref:site-specific DNA-methyltransferase (adenine-specific) n=1 Tax=Fodinibius roseus TaxID=1194090 RepID=A0A1M5I9D1_9BACT|nr:site-specific DNA-methyltransferase [Fodinibius roseus]SHG24837.1 adenine-specific DNA-methyltransferase [Fodinibius roseus]
MSIEDLSEKEKSKIIDYIKNDENLPKEYIYKLFSDDEDVFLFWNGRNEEPTNIVLPFHSIEHIDEPRKEKIEGSGELFDNRGRQIEGWTNKLIWGDNKLILSSLVNGPIREQIEDQGGLKLIYIDPPFAVGADFSFSIDLNGEDITKQQSIVEEIAYRDTWGRGVSSYLNMMYERLKIMYDLLATNGSIYVHCDWRLDSYLKLLLDEIFSSNYRGEIIWKKDAVGKGAKKNADHWPKTFDKIYCYSKTDNYTFNFLGADLTEKQLKEFRYEDPDGRKFKRTTLGDYSDESIKKMEKQNLIYTSSSGKKYKKYYLDEYTIQQDSLWMDIPGFGVATASKERVGYPTQKPEEILERILEVSSNQGNLVADFFCGSGTLPAVAEKKNRKWIAADLGRFAIHTTRKRMIDVQRALKEKGEDYRAFQLLNLGKYERQHFFGVPTNVSEEKQQQILEVKQEKYISLILEGYSAIKVDGYKYLHGKRATRFVHVGPLNIPVTRDLVESVYQECKDDIITQVDILGFEFEMGLAPFVEEQMKDKGVDIRLKNIPREVFDPRAVEKGQVKFFDVAYLDADTEVDGKEVHVTLSNFVTSYTQDDIEEVENNLRKGSSKIVIESGEIIKVTKEGDGIYNRESLTNSWTDWIDYWAVDFNYESNKEIIKVEEDGELKEKWTGNYIFENEWQSFRTKQDNELELTSAPHEYKEPGRYKIMVKVVDILGVDTSQVFEVKVDG